MADSSDVIFQQVITFVCLSKLLTWAKAKQQSLKSSADNTGSLPTDLSGIVHAVIYKIHTHGVSSRSAPSLQLKSKLPAFCHLNRSVNTALSAGNANCCLVAQCLYVALANTSEPKTPAQHKRATRQNAQLRICYIVVSGELTKSPAIPQQLYKPVSRGLLAIAELLV